MSTTRLMILGLVNWMEPVHGYDVRRELLSWNADKWAKIQPGSIYHALKKMTEEGLLEAVATEQVGARPERTTYKITVRGKDAFENMLREQWWEIQTGSDPFTAAFAFLPALPRKEAVAALRHRGRMLTVTTQGLRDMIATGRTDITKPVHVQWMFELWIARAEGEIVWCERVAELIESGVSYMTGTSAEVDEEAGWKAYRDKVADV
ncbi:MAG: PadR family transcriptional regulator [Hamadaea sp.]|uniref:PadR family transcriptional regulator n=1 Tax=Hamadaea sp. TaxID=2024425 RepID=UPI0017AF4359|nr:PadR family transcriptional regulator [Hamadaea sp.]NUR72279.1 PadR family transcriptional regulator [Hamadaea sp.]NUT23235.1 PadR family transcriptional regulator [Hamadaea sp.]